MMSTGAEANRRSMPGMRPADHIDGEHDGHHAGHQQQHVPVAHPARRPGHARSASTGMPMGATTTRPANRAACRPRSPVLGRWKVTVTSASTTGSEGTPLLRSTEVGRIDRQHRHARRMGTHAHLDTGHDGLPKCAPHTRAQQGIDDQPARSMPLSIRRISREVAAVWSARPASRPSRRSQLMRASGVAGRPSAMTRTTTLRRPVPASVARRPTRRRRCCPARHSTSTWPVRRAGRSAPSMARATAPTAVPASSINASPLTPIRCARRSAPRIPSGGIGARVARDSSSRRSRPDPGRARCGRTSATGSHPTS